MTDLPFDQPVERPIHPAALPDDELLAQCVIARSRTGGPGGQHRNKVETAVSLTHEPTGISASASERRSVRENKPVALRRLRLVLATEHRVAVPNGEIRSALWKERCTGTRVVINPKHHDYPSLLAEALDVLDACGYDTTKASTRLGCSASQLCRLIRHHPPAWASMNKARESRGMRFLR